MALTEIAVKQAKPKDKAYKLTDAGSLFLFISPSGGKSWRWRYYADDKQKLLTLGMYPDVSLAKARELRDEARREKNTGRDPMQERKTVKLVRQIAAENSFAAVAEAWFEFWKPTKSPRHAEYVIKRLRADVFPEIGGRPISAIQTTEVVAMTKKIAARGALDIAKRCFQTCGQIFRYAGVHGLTSSNPLAEIKPSDFLTQRTKENFARLDANELPGLLRQIEAYQGAAITRLAMKLMALTFVRTSELIGARWEEFDFEANQWRIPAARMKMRSEHIVPLAPQALDVLKTLRLISGHSKLLFPGERDHEKPMSNNTILGALKRMGYKGQMTGHGFRGIASTVLHEHDFPHEHIELQLAHMERKSASSAYNHAKYLVQRRDMMNYWGTFLDQCLGGKVLRPNFKRVA
jgi:integrase